ncbi:MAG: HD domain-containing protein [Ruminococcus sp.]|nr:HD domain-containing protein [Ruminococcus sp.]
MKDYERLELAYRYAEEKHRGQYRKGGQPYISHPVAVAEIMRERGLGIDYQITALFHDLLEDTDASEEIIEQIGGKAVLKAVRLLTKTEGYIMSEYIEGIKSNPIAFAVKGADRLHNLRSAFIADMDFKKRYIRESIEWYLDFCPEIPEAVNALADSIVYEF